MVAVGDDEVAAGAAEITEEQKMRVRNRDRSRAGGLDALRDMRIEAYGSGLQQRLLQFKQRSALLSAALLVPTAAPSSASPTQNLALFDLARCDQHHLATDFAAFPEVKNFRN